MNISFEKAPLIEIVAELRWQPEAAIESLGARNGAPILAGPSVNTLEEFFMRFGGECYQVGFQQSERLHPVGFPLFPFQPIYRYRKTGLAGQPQPSELMQVGAGLFSANAVPPYRSWSAFSPIVEQGVQALLNARSGAERARPFSGVSLRYIDAFGIDFLGKRSPGEFITEVLGFSVVLPRPVQSAGLPGRPVNAVIQLTMSAPDGLNIGMTVGEALVNGAQAVLLDTTVSAAAPVEPTLESVMTTLGAARNVIHECFVELVKPLADIMRPMEG
jgi:uncharacterized protein (TIGR04255 family)